MLTLNIFSSVLCQEVHPKSSLRNLCRFCLLKSPFWFFLKTQLLAKESSFKIISASSLMYLAVTRRSLVNSSSADFGAYSANQCNQNQVNDIFGVSFHLIVLFVFFLILTFVLQRVTLKQFLLVP